MSPAYMHAWPAVLCTATDVGMHGLLASQSCYHSVLSPCWCVLPPCWCTLSASSRFHFCYSCPSLHPFGFVRNLFVYLFVYFFFLIIIAKDNCCIHIGADLIKKFVFKDIHVNKNNQLNPDVGFAHTCKERVIYAASKQQIGNITQKYKWQATELYICCLILLCNIQLFASCIAVPVGGVQLLFLFTCMSLKKIWLNQQLSLQWLLRKKSTQTSKQKGF